MLKVTLSTFVELVFLYSDNKLKKSREWWGEGGGGEGCWSQGWGAEEELLHRTSNLEMFASNFRKLSIKLNLSETGG